MRANLGQNEPQSRKRWDQANLYDTVQAARRAEGGAPFVFHDGPPYTSGSIHVGHLVNKVLKDIVVRSRLLEGHPCPYVARDLADDLDGLGVDLGLDVAVRADGELVAGQRDVALDAAVDLEILVSRKLALERDRLADVRHGSPLRGGVFARAPARLRGAFGRSGRSRRGRTSAERAVVA